MSAKEAVETKVTKFDPKQDIVVQFLEPGFPSVVALWLQQANAHLGVPHDQVVKSVDVKTGRFVLEAGLKHRDECVENFRNAAELKGRTWRHAMVQGKKTAAVSQSYQAEAEEPGAARIREMEAKNSELGEEVLRSKKGVEAAEGRIKELEKKLAALETKEKSK